MKSNGPAPGVRNSVVRVDAALILDVRVGAPRDRLRHALGDGDGEDVEMADVEVDPHG
jgi:hypothetical protein